MGLNYNDPVDQGLPNQAGVGPNYTAQMDGAPGNTLVHRKGVITRLDLTGNLTASRTLQFAAPNIATGADVWLPGDTVFIQVPTHTGSGFTITVLNLAGDAIASWPALVANGGMFVYGASTVAGPTGPDAPVDFGAILPGGGGGGSSPADTVVADGPQSFGIDWTIGPGDAHGITIQDGVSDFINLSSGEVSAGDAQGDSLSMSGGSVNVSDTDGDGIELGNSSILIEDAAGDSIQMGTAVGLNGGVAIAGIGSGATITITDDAGSITIEDDAVNIDAVRTVSIATTTATAVEIGNVDTSLTVPTMTQTQRNALNSSAPFKGSILYDTTTNQPEVNVGTTSAPIWAAMAAQYSAAPLSLTEGQVTVSNVNLTTASVILVSVAGPAPGSGSLTVRYDVLASSRTNGQGTGSFTISALNAAGTLQNLDTSTGVRWAIIGQ
jgi:hypothetical protein